LRELDYSCWRAAETDLAAWLTAQGRDQEAAALLDTATAALESLGTTPALARARKLAGSPTPAAIVG
jgi:hypothetical protein